MKNLDKLPLSKKNILIRVDLNVPFVNEKITEKSRIDIIKPTIKKLQKQKNKIFLISHFGRPKGIYNKKYSLEFILPTLENELNLKKIYFQKNIDEKEIKNLIKIMKPGEVCLFANIRFYSGEENNNLLFAESISKHFDAFINDAFSASHRSHASIVGIPKYLPSYAGNALINEINNINLFINNPKKPNLAIIGGSKISTKIDLLANLSKTVDTIIIGGAMANTFLLSQGFDTGKSLCEKQLIKTSISILNKAKNLNCKIILPIDVVCAENINDTSNIIECDIDSVKSKQMILDIGKKTIKLISEYISISNSILWNGPLGAFEYKPFEKSSIEIANFIKNRSKDQSISTIAGGGDTISAIKNANAIDGFSYISKAGGAFLEWLEGKGSPGVDALNKNN